MKYNTIIHAICLLVMPLFVFHFACGTGSDDDDDNDSNPSDDDTDAGDDDDTNGTDPDDDDLIPDHDDDNDDMGQPVGDVVIATQKSRFLQLYDASDSQTTLFNPKQKIGQLELELVQGVFEYENSIDAGPDLAPGTDLNFTDMIVIRPRVKIDNSGYIHLAYVGFSSSNNSLQSIMYATNRSGTWQKTAVADPVYGCFIIELTLDSNDNAHIAYAESSRGLLKYATNRSGTWKKQTVAIRPIWDLDIQVDSADNPAIFYADMPLIGTGTHLAVKQGNTWNKELVMEFPYIAMPALTWFEDASLAFDSNDNPQVSITYQEISGVIDLWSESYVYVASKETGDWNIEEVYHSGIKTECESNMLIDSNDIDHIFVSDVDSQLLYFTNQAGSWKDDRLRTTGTYLDMAFDRLERTHLVYTYKNTLRYGVYQSGEFENDLLDRARGLAADNQPSLAIDSQGYLHATFQSGDDDFFHATNQSGAWETERIDWISTDHSLNSIDVDSNDISHVLYRNRFLFYASNATGTWESEQINSTSYADGLVLRLDASDQIHGAFSDSYAGELNYLTGYAGSWSIQTVDTINDETGVDLRLDGSDNAHIIYRNNDSLAYATNRTGSWVVENPFHSLTIGPILSLRVDALGSVHISCFDSTNYGLLYLSNASGTWTQTVVDSTGYAGYYSSIFVDQDNKIHITYNNSNKWDLVYATNITGIWLVTSIDTAGLVGENSVLEMDPDGLFHAIYRDFNGLMHASFPPGYTGN